MSPRSRYQELIYCDLSWVGLQPRIDFTLGEEACMPELCYVKHGNSVDAVGESTTARHPRPCIQEDPGFDQVWVPAARTDHGPPWRKM